MVARDPPPRRAAEADDATGALASAAHAHLERVPIQHVHATPHRAQPAEALRQLRGAVHAANVRGGAEDAERAQVAAHGAHAVGRRRRRPRLRRRRRVLQDGVERELGQGGREALPRRKVEESALGVRDGRRRGVGRGARLGALADGRLERGLQRDA